MTWHLIDDPDNQVVVDVVRALRDDEYRSEISKQLEGYGVFDLRLDAADEIERLRAQVADLRGENAVLCQADGCGMPGPCMARNCQHPWSSASDTQEIE